MSNVTFYFYHALIKYKDQYTDIPFQNLLDYIIVKEEDERFQETTLGEFSVLRMKVPDEQRDHGDRSFFIGDYRIKKPYKGQKRSDHFSEISSDVLEPTTCFYQHTERMLIMQYNHYGAKIRQIASYFNKFLLEDWEVEFLPLDPTIDIKDVFKSDDIRSLDIKIDLSANQAPFINDAKENTSHLSVMAQLIHGTTKLQKEIGGNVATISFGNGRRKRNNLKVEEIKNILKVLDLDSDLFMSIKIKYLSPSDKKVVELDLKNASILKATLDLDVDAWESVSKAIEDHWYDEGRLGAKQLEKRVQEKKIVFKTIDHSPFD